MTGVAWFVVTCVVAFLVSIPLVMFMLWLGDW